MPRHDLFVAQRIALLHGRRQFRTQGSIARADILEIPPHALRNRPGLVLAVRIRRLRQIDELAIIAEVARNQFRMPVEPQAANDQPLEMAQWKIREVEGPRLSRSERGEHRRRGKEFIAVRSGYSLDSLLAQYCIQQPARTAIGIGDKDGMVTVPRSLNRGAHGAGYLLRSIVQLGRQTTDVQVVPAIGAAQCCDLVGQRAAGNDQRGHRPTQWAAAPARLAAMRPLAVSTATAASRQ